MKLRIKGNSIRLRLLRSEVELFARAGRVSDTTEFGGTDNGFLTYSLVLSPAGSSVASQFRGREITVSVPEDIAREWATSDDIGIEAEQTIGDGEFLTILVEKDFVCVGRRDDPDRDDAFKYPEQRK